MEKINKQNKPLVILGGMGPQASVFMHKTLIDLAVSEFQVVNNHDFPHIIIESIPVPDFISNEKNKFLALKILSKRIIEINKSDISCLSLACNTAHLLLNKLQRHSKFPFVSMIDEVVDEVKKNEIKKIGLLASPLTIKSDLYQKAFKKHKINVLSPGSKDIGIIESVIKNVIAGKYSKSDKELLESIAERLKTKGAECIVLGCTELPLIFPQKFTIPIFNSVKILSMALLRKYYQKN